MLQGRSVKILNLEDKNEKKMNDSAGDRTQNLWFRRPAPYPLGHGVTDAVSSESLMLLVTLFRKNTIDRLLF